MCVAKGVLSILPLFELRSAHPHLLPSLISDVYMIMRTYGHWSLPAPIKMSPLKCRGKNIAIKMSRIKMSLHYNVAGENDVEGK